MVEVVKDKGDFTIHVYTRHTQCTLTRTSTKYKPVYLIREIPFDLMRIPALFHLNECVARKQ